MSGNRERRTTIGGQFARRRIDMLESYACRVLSLSARRVLDRLEIEMAKHAAPTTAVCPAPTTTSNGIDRQAIDLAS